MAVSNSVKRAAPPDWLQALAAISLPQIYWYTVELPRCARARATFQSTVTSPATTIVLMLRFNASGMSLSFSSYVGRGNVKAILGSSDTGVGREVRFPTIIQSLLPQAIVIEQARSMDAGMTRHQPDDGRV